MRKKLLVCFIAVVCFCAACMVACNEPHAHTFDQMVVEDAYLATEATCAAKATYYKSCVCGEKSTETFEYGNFAEHTKAAELSKNDTHHWYACQNEDCNEKFDEVKHSFEDAINFEGKICNVCSYEKPATEGLEYELNADGQSYYVKGIGTATATEIVIASVYNGMPVTSIGERAFFDCDRLTSIDIPDRATLPSLHPQNNYCTL